jgi:hypothetical protein
MMAHAKIVLSLPSKSTSTVFAKHIRMWPSFAVHTIRCTGNKVQCFRVFPFRDTMVYASNAMSPLPCTSEYLLSSILLSREKKPFLRTSSK